MTEGEEITITIESNEGTMRKPFCFYVDRINVQKTCYMRLLASITITSFGCFCIFLALFMLPDDHVHENSIRDDAATSPQFLKRIRAVKAMNGHPSYIYHRGDDFENHLQGTSNGKPFLETPESNYDMEDEHYDNDDNGGDDDYVDDDDDEAEDYENVDERPVNEVFKAGDFDYVKNNPSRFKSTDEGGGHVVPFVHPMRNSQQMFRIKFVKSPHGGRRPSTVETQRRLNNRIIKRFRNVSLVNFDGVPIVEDRIYWSEELEERCPRGLSDLEVNIVRDKLRRLEVDSVHPPTWDRCGRPKNLYVVFEDGSKACARYRAPHQYLVDGEVLSFYLSRLLGVHNVPVATLLSSDSRERRWGNSVSVKRTLAESKWEPNVTVAFIQWIDDLERNKMPHFILSNLLNGTVISTRNAGLYGLSSDELVELVQWSDLVIFDYITGNYDRVASMQDAADKERRPAILNDTVHNLARSSSTGGLWLIDNESGLLDGYALLYGKPGKDRGDDRFLNFHAQMLNLTCLFRRSTVQRIRWLHDSGRAGQLLLDTVRRSEPLFKGVEDSDVLSKRIQSRVSEVHAHISRCYESI